MPTTRRDFVKTSLLAGAAAATAKLSGAQVTTPPLAAQSPQSPAGPPHPMLPYGSGQPIYLADLDRCEPAAAMTKTWQPNRWRRYEFETAQVKGTMLAAGQNTGVPDLEYTLPQTGWFAISFGIVSKYWESRLQVRFKRDSVFTILTPNNLAEAGLMWDDIQWSKHPYNSPDIEDLFWRYVHLDGSNAALVFRQLKTQTLPGNPDQFGNIFLPCWLAYIKLVPLSPAEVTKLEADRKRTDTRRLFAADDAFSSGAMLHFQTKADVQRQLEPYRDTDFSRIYWEAGAGDVTNFPSKVGRLNTFGWMNEHYRLCDRLASETMQGFQKQGIDPFRVAIDYSHELGLEFHASYRVAGFYFPAPEDEWNAGGLYHQHPEWRSYDRQGRPGPRLSYAIPGVRDFVHSLMEEVTTFPVDGLCLLYNRRLPVLGYEPVLTDSFKAKHGVDPRTLDEKDPRWLAHSAAVLTEFMRELRRRMVAQATKQKRKPIGITAVVMSSIEENYEFGLDLKTWVQEGLIDTLVPYSSVRGISSRMVAWDNPNDVVPFVQMTKGTACKLAPNLMPRGISPEDYKRRADALYQAGVDNLFMWDCFGRINFDPSWTALSRLGHKEELAAWRARGRPPIERPRSQLTRIGDWDLSFQTPG